MQTTTQRIPQLTTKSGINTVTLPHLPPPSPAEDDHEHGDQETEAERLERETWEVELEGGVEPLGPKGIIGPRMTELIEVQE